MEGNKQQNIYNYKKLLVEKKFFFCIVLQNDQRGKVGSGKGKEITKCNHSVKIVLDTNNNINKNYSS